MTYFTNLQDVLAVTLQYSFWIAIYPLVGFWGLILNGVFTGATFIDPIRNSLIVSMLLFLATAAIFIPLFGNYGLWFAFIIFSLARSIVLNLSTKKLQIFIDS